MAFASPWFLLLLAPWTALVLYLLWGRRHRANVPFLKLWEGPVQSPPPKQSFEKPPLWVGAIIAAMLLAILAAGQPFIRDGHDEGARISILVDRGLSMSAPGRLSKLAAESAPAIANALGGGVVDLVAVPGNAVQTTTHAQWPSLVAGMSPTAVDTRHALHAAITDRLNSTAGPVIVLTDQALSIDSPRILRIAPAEPSANVAITHLAIRESPARQAMVRLRNDSSLTQARLRISSDGVAARETPVDLPPAGDSRDFFIDLPATGRTLVAELIAADDLPADNRFHLVRQRLWPTIEPRTALPPAVQRMATSYARIRPPGEGSRRILIASSVESAPPDQAAIILIPETGSTPARGDRQVADHPLARAVDEWPDAPASDIDPPAGWTPVLRLGDRIVVAARSTPARQAWVNIPMQTWATSRGFVVFWTNLFDWTGEGGETFASQPAAALGEGWKPAEGTLPQGLEPGQWPAIYRRADGHLIAINAGDYPPTSPTPDWPQRLSALQPQSASQSHAYPLTWLLALLALLSTTLSAATWRRA